LDLGLRHPLSQVLIRNQLLKDKVHAELKEKALVVELEKCHEFMLQINEESFQ